MTKKNEDITTSRKVGTSVSTRSGSIEERKDAFKMWTESYSAMSKVWQKSYADLYNPWIESTGKLFDKASELSKETSPEKYREFYEELVKTQENTLSRIYPMPKAMMDRKTLEKLATSARESAHLMKTWSAEFEENSRKTQKMLSGGAGTEDYKSSYEMWIKSYEKMFDEFLDMMTSKNTKDVFEATWERHVTHGLRAHCLTTLRCPSCRQPRLPMNRPRAGSATMSPHGVSRFCKGMAPSSRPKAPDTVPDPDDKASPQRPTADRAGKGLGLCRQLSGPGGSIREPVGTKRSRLAVSRRAERARPADHRMRQSPDQFPAGGSRQIRQPDASSTPPSAACSRRYSSRSSCRGCPNTRRDRATPCFRRWSAAPDRGSHWRTRGRRPRVRDGRAAMSVNLDNDMRMAAELSQLRQDMAALKFALRSKEEAIAGLRLENADLRIKLCSVAQAVEKMVREYLP